jgi:hypothetical protein
MADKFSILVGLVWEFNSWSFHFHHSGLIQDILTAAIALLVGLLCSYICNKNKIYCGDY